MEIFKIVTGDIAISQIRHATLGTPVKGPTTVYLQDPTSHLFFYTQGNGTVDDDDVCRQDSISRLFISLHDTVHVE